MPETFDYSTPGSENVTLLNALINDETPYTEDTHSRNAEILKSIINNTEYTDAPQSEIEELLLELKEKIGGEVEIDELNVTENGTYSETGKAYSPVNVNVQPELITKTITANGTYNASSDDADGYSSVTVAVEGYAKKSISPAPTPIATFNASALPMPSLSVGIEAVQAGTGDPSPTNVRPFSGWSAVNRYRTGENLYNIRESRYMSEANLRKLNSGDTLYVNTNFMSNFTLYIKYTGDETATEYTISQNTLTTITLTNTVAVIAVSQSVADNITGTGKDVKIYHNGTTNTTQLKDGQGNPMTCYGGQLVNENGVQTLDNTDGFVENMGTLTWNNNSTDSVYASIASIKRNSNIICSALKTVPSSTQVTQMNSGEIRLGENSPNIVVKLTGITPQNAQTMLTGYQLKYELATPEEIPQDNLPIASQSGTNNMWADTGDIQSGEYMEAL